MVHPRGLNHISFVISAVTTTQCSMKKLEKLSLKKNHANHNFVIYIFVNAQKVVHPRGFNHMSFVISAVTTTQCSMKKLEKLSLKKNLANHTGLLDRSVIISKHEGEKVAYTSLKRSVDVFCSSKKLDIFF